MTRPVRALPLVSFIVPVLGEGKIINSFLEDLFRLNEIGRCEVILVDGHPARTTVSALDSSWLAKVVTLEAARGRSLQMNVGAARARAAILLFLHADTRLPSDTVGLVKAALAEQKIVGGAFGLEIDTRLPALKSLAWLTTHRSRISRIPYGDQAIFLRKQVFDQLGGYAPIPIMEDVDLMQRIRRRRLPIVILSAKSKTSARRWEKEGVVLGTLRNRMLMLLFGLGVSAQKLSSWYRS